jgi:DNA-binding NarL/FixJ family response regulator
MTADKIRVLLVDNHEMFREGLRELLNRWPDVEVVAEAGNGQQALEGMKTRPDVVVLDIKLPDTDGVAVCRQILQEHPGARVIMLTMYADEEHLFQALKSGAVGYVLKDASSEKVVSAIRAAARGQSELDPASTAKLVGEYVRLQREQATAGHSPPTERELIMLALISGGARNKGIAAHLAMSEQTVKNGLSILYQKLRVKNRAEAVMAAMQQGIRLPKV